MESILDWIKTEGLVFKGGSGSGVNLSNLRAKGESLSSGGQSSGVISFMKAADAVAGSIKSGGTTRRAAKMVILNADHPEIMDFIKIKSEEENKIRMFIEAGYDLTDMNNPLWQNIFFQNANNSVRIPDELMLAAKNNKEWNTIYKKTKEVAQTYKAKDILMEIAKSAFLCGDPGVQFDSTIQKWNTCKNSGNINATNPCAEYLFFDNTSCNLSSINLLKYLKSDGTFDIKGFKHTIKIMFLAQDILIHMADYPTEKIGEETKKYRTIGLGYANLGALIMAMGFAYDSDEARFLASSISSLMTAEAYKFSALISKKLGAFSEFEKNKESIFEVIQMHKNESEKIQLNQVNANILEESKKSWEEVIELGEKYGFRNAQVSLLAPTGTIGLAMDCDTTGVEPEFALIKVKQLVGGGIIKYVNKTVNLALKKLNYTKEEILEIVAHLEQTGNIETAPNIKQEHLAIFDTAIKPPKGNRMINWRGHVKMVVAVQPFVSGGISKTFNMPNDATVEDIYDAHLEAWEMGIKCFAVYRDGSKATQALYSGKEKSSKKGKSNSEERRLYRKKLPDVRKSETHKFSISGHEGYLTYSFFEDESLGEIFIRMSKQGSTLAGLLDAFAIAVSIALQYGVPLKDLVSKFIHMRFDPLGITTNNDIQFASSIIDYIFKYLAKRFLNEDDLILMGLVEKENISLHQHPKLFLNGNDNGNLQSQSSSENGRELSGPPCKKCGGMTIRTGSCYSCVECGETSGGCG